MKIIVHLHTILQLDTQTGPIERLDFFIPPGTRLADVLQIINIRIKPEGLLMVVNGRLAGKDNILTDGDEIDLIPAISGETRSKH